MNSRQHEYSNYSSRYRQPPVISGNPTLDSLLWELSLVIREIAKRIVDEERRASKNIAANIQDEGNLGQTLASTEKERLVLKPTEVAEALGISRAKAYELVHTGEIPSIRAGNRILIPRKALERWLEERVAGG